MPPIERVVAILTPAFGAVAAVVTGWLGKHFPGLPALSPSDVTALEIAGFTGAVGAALKWLHGRQKFVQPVVDAEHIAETTARKLMANQVAAPALEDIAAVVKANTDQTIKAIGDKIGVGPSVEQVMQEMARAALGEQPAPQQAPAETIIQGAAVEPAPPPPAA